jgi:hypothetical protein
MTTARIRVPLIMMHSAIGTHAVREEEAIHVQTTFTNASASPP